MSIFADNNFRHIEAFFQGREAADLLVVTDDAEIERLFDAKGLHAMVIEKNFTHVCMRAMELFETGWRPGHEWTMFSMWNGRSAVGFRDLVDATDFRLRL